MSKVLFAAHHQWALRLPDERFPRVEFLYVFMGDRKRDSLEEIMPVGEMKIYSTYGGTVAGNGNLPLSVLAKLSSGQLGELAEAPYKYLKTPTHQLTVCGYAYNYLYRKTPVFRLDSLTKTKNARFEQIDIKGERPDHAGHFHIAKEVLKRISFGYSYSVPLGGAGFVGYKEKRPV